MFRLNGGSTNACPVRVVDGFHYPAAPLGVQTVMTGMPFTPTA